MTEYWNEQNNPLENTPAQETAPAMPEQMPIETQAVEQPAEPIAEPQPKLYTVPQQPENDPASAQPHTTAFPPYDADVAARTQAQAYAQTYPQSPYARQTPNYYTTAPEGGKKKHKKRGHGALLVISCIVLSLVCGFAGAYAANRWFPPEQAQSGGSSLIEAPLHTDTATASGLPSLSAVITTTKDSVVEITTESVSTSSFFGQFVTEGAGSGVVARADGYIVTNNHVVSGATNIKVTLTNGEVYAATLIGTDSKTDLAVIKIEASGLTPAVFGNSADVAVGDYVIAIGNPLGSLGGTVTDGIVSALDREILVQGQSMTLLQTSAAINPGNSGGGLFNIYGELVGIVNAKPTDSAAGSDSSIDGLGFAIPVDTVKDVVNELIDNGYVTGRAAMGVKVLEIADNQTAYQYGVERYGVYIVEINPGSGAEKAGLEVGDCIVSINDKLVETTSDVTSELDNFSVGDTITLQVIRDRRIVTAQVVLGESVPG